MKGFTGRQKLEEKGHGNLGFMYNPNLSQFKKLDF